MDVREELKQKLQKDLCLRRFTSVTVLLTDTEDTGLNDVFVKDTA